MPNWCSNTAVINGPRPVIDDIKSVIEHPEQGLLSWMRPMPADQRDNWYDWCVSNWGTKWDVTEAMICDETEEDSITLSFDTAWGPPLDAFRSWAERDGRVTYRLIYLEPGMGFVGWDSYDGEFFDEDYVEQGDDEERYWEMAADEFGYERDEEPEPLTEWYEEGVREKGLDK